MRNSENVVANLIGLRIVPTSKPLEHNHVGVTTSHFPRECEVGIIQHSSASRYLETDISDLLTG